MNTYTKLQVTEIQYIVKFLLLDTQNIDTIPSNIESIRTLASSLLDKCDIIEKEQYALAE